MYDKKNQLTIIVSVVVSLLIIEFLLRIIGFEKYEFKGYPPYYLTNVGDYDNFDIRANVKETDFIFNDNLFVNKIDFSLIKISSKIFKK